MFSWKPGLLAAFAHFLFIFFVLIITHFLHGMINFESSQTVNLELYVFLIISIETIEHGEQQKNIFSKVEHSHIMYYK